MSTIRKACAGGCGAAAGAGLLMHAPCILIASGMAAGLSASAAVSASLFGALTLAVSSAMALILPSLRKNPITAWHAVASGALLAASVPMLDTHLSNRVNTVQLQGQEPILQAPKMSLMDKERLIRVSICGPQPR